VLSLQGEVELRRERSSTGWVSKVIAGVAVTAVVTSSHLIPTLLGGGVGAQAPAVAARIRASATPAAADRLEPVRFVVIVDSSSCRVVRDAPTTGCSVTDRRRRRISTGAAFDSVLALMPPEVDAGHTGWVRLVIVDDHDEFRAVARLVMGGAGIEVVDEASCAADAEAAIDRSDPDVVLVDVGLPDGDGFDLVARLAPSRIGIRWVLTSTREDGQVTRLIDSPACAFVPKHELTAVRLRVATAGGASSV
jgi:CheY-like chemotaxis protein